MIVKKTLIIIAGPTSVGKTEVCIDLAQHFGTEIINCDSRQMYREMPIGSGCPDAEQLQAVKHHFIGERSVLEYYNAGRYEEDAMKRIKELFQHHCFVVVSAGSGMYLDAIVRGIDYMPEYNSELRRTLNEKLEHDGLHSLLQQLEAVDPEYYKTVDKNNVQRILRGLEVFELTGKPFSEFRVKEHKKRDFDMIKIVLQREREDLYCRINQRVENMMMAGLENEARNLYSLKHLVALKTIGYRELFDYFDGKTDLQEAVRLIQRNTRHLARRQLTWFRAKTDFKDMPADNFGTILRYISMQTNN